MNDAVRTGFCIKPGYRHREKAEYFVDDLHEHGGVVHQPDVYPFAAHLAGRQGCRWIVDVGCGRAAKLLPLASSFDLFGIDFGENFRWCRDQTSLEVVEWNLELPGRLPVPDDVVQDSVVVCADVIEHLVDPRPLVENLVRLSASAATVLVSTPDRDRVRGPEDIGPPGNPAHVREWAFGELVGLFTAAGMAPSFAGLTRSNDRDPAKDTTLLCLDDAVPEGEPPAGFDVLAVIPAYNEEDVIVPVVRKLLDQGVRVRLIDNWSTDATVSRVEALGRAAVAVERFPSDGPSSHYEWRRILDRVEQVNDEERADWLILQSADEVIRPPWPGVDLRRALWTVERRGFSAVEHTVIDFRPTTGRHYDGQDPEDFFRHFEFPGRPGSFNQIKTWRRAPGVSLAPGGGHDAAFEGRRVFPYKFLLKHYPIRSPEHGRRKVLLERVPRWSPGERASGWHVQYDRFQDASDFSWRAENLIQYDEPEFQREYLVERLSGVGIRRELSPA